MFDLSFLYNNLVTNTQWYNQYKEISEKVEDYRQAFDNEEHLDIDKEVDKAFLKKLIYENQNGISSSGQSKISYNSFNELVNDDDFREKLDNFIQNPVYNSYKKLEDKWKEIATSKGFKMNWLLVHRVAAASTTEVSCVGSTEKFYRVFNWLKDKNIIQNNDRTNWFQDNKVVMKALKSNLSNIAQKNGSITKSVGFLRF